MKDGTAPTVVLFDKFIHHPLHYVLVTISGALSLNVFQKKKLLTFESFFLSATFQG